MAEPTDFDLMEKIQARERRAHFILKDRYRKRLFEIAFAILKEPHKAEDVVRQVFEFSWRQSSIFDLERDRSVAIWLYELAGFYARERKKRWPWLKSASSLVPTNRSLADLKWAIGLLVGLVAYAGGITWQYVHLRHQWITQVDLSLITIQKLYSEWQKKPDTQRLTLRDPLFKSDSLAQVLWSPSQRQIILLASNFPLPPQGKTYQLWATSSLENSDQANQPTGEIVESVGIFSSRVDGTIQWLSQSLSIPRLDRLFLTLEVEGGSDRPTGSILLESLEAIQTEPSPPKD
jgi:hypothetical protein